MGFNFKKLTKIIATVLVVAIVGVVTLTTLTPKTAEATVKSAIGGAIAGCAGAAAVGAAVSWWVGGAGGLISGGTCLAAAAIGGLAGHAAPAAIGEAVTEVAKSSLGGAVYFLFKVIFHLLVAIFGIVTFFLDSLINLGLSSSSYNAPAIKTGWTIVRDISNIFFLFILLYISITTIIGKNGANTYKLLGQVIAAALLINFSLAIGRTVIDSSNILANEFWSKLYSQESTLSDKIVKAANLDSMIGLNLPEISDGSDNPNDFQHQAIMYLGIDIFMLVAILVLLFGSFLFLMRILALAIILTLSPVAFIGSIIPATEPYAKDWWLKLFNQSFVAPAFLFFIYLAVIIVTPAPNPTPFSTAMAVAIAGARDANSAGAFNVFIQYAMAMGFLVAAVIAANKLGGTTAKLATAATGSALGLGVAGVASVGQASIGKVAANVAKSTASASPDSWKGKIHGAASTISQSSFDFTKAKIPDAVPVFGGTQLGQRAVSGIAQATGIKIAPEVKTAGFVQGQKAEADIKKKEDLERQKAREKIKNQETLETVSGIVTPTINATDSAAVKAEKQIEIDQKNIKMQAILKKFSADDIIGMKDDIMKDPSKLSNLDARGVKALAERGDLTGDEQQKMRDSVEGNKSNTSGSKYYKDIRDEENEAEVKNVIAPKIQVALDAGNLTELARLMGELKAGQWQHLPPAMLVNPAATGLISSQGIEEIARNVTKMGFTYAQRKLLLDNAKKSTNPDVKVYAESTAAHDAILKKT